MRALVVGGTGPTGPHLVQGLLDRGYEVAIFHRGVHESDELPEVEHIHGDPHFKETIAAALEGRSFDLVLAMYGRIRFLAEVMAGRCHRFISVGGSPAVRGQEDPGKVHPFGLKATVRETDPVVTSADEAKAGYMIALTEQMIFSLHGQGAFSATHFRYPQIYGRRALNPKEWSVIKRIQDNREYMIIPDNGLLIKSRAAARNAAHCVLLAVDKPDVASGQLYHCGDDEQFTVRQWYELMIEMVGGNLQLIPLPEILAAPFHVIVKPHHHMFMDTTKVKQELGYRDVISPQEGLREAIEWCLANPVTKEAYPNYPDPFAYEQEDRVVEAYKGFIKAVREMTPLEVQRPHTYAHPKQPGLIDHHGR